jgi:carboxyl-terminal processing protease
VFLDNEKSSGLQEELKWSSEFEGIGAIITKKDYYVQIDEVVKGSPAFTAGLRMLDRIIMINTWSTKNLDINQAVSLIRWPKWTTVKLTIERIPKKIDNEIVGKEILEKEIVRDKLLIPSVNGKIISWSKGEILGYINISVIGEETENFLRKTISELKTQKIQGIILDLRGNW